LRLGRLAGCIRASGDQRRDAGGTQRQHDWTHGHLELLNRFHG
jgi:hypothetical protein